MIGALLLLAALATPSDTQVVVRARGMALTTADVIQTASRLRAESKPFTPDQLVDGLISEIALAAEARRRGLDADPECKAVVEYGRVRFLADLFARQVVKIPKPTDADARAAFHLRGDTAHLQSVVVATREEAAAVRERVAKGADIGLEAVRSLDPAGASRRGDTGVLPRIVLNEQLAAAVFAAPRGGLVGPIQTGNGWTIAKVLETTIGTEEQFAAAREQIDAFLMSKLATQARAHAVEMLRGRARISIDEPFLASAGRRATPTPAEADHVTLTVNDRTFRYRELLPALRGVGRTGHGSSKMISGAIDDFASEFLLATEARTRGLDRAPATVAALERTDIHMLAEFLGRRLLAEAQAKGSAKEQTAAFLKRIEALKQLNDVWVDRPAALAAVSQSK